MKKMLLLLATGIFPAMSSNHLQAADKATAPAKTPAVLNFKMKSLTGKTVDLVKYHGKVVVIVNTASECGYTPQYAGLQEVFNTHNKQGLVVLGFPCNQFGAQEPGSEKEIASFCEKNYGVAFDMFAKVDVNGEGQCGLFKFLTSSETDPKFAGPVKWNFEKFLIGRGGDVVARFPSGTEPTSEEFVKSIKAELAK